MRETHLSASRRRFRLNFTLRNMNTADQSEAPLCSPASSRMVTSLNQLFY